MTRSSVAAVARRKPLQTAKFVGILAAILLGVGGFLRLFELGTVAGSPLLGDGQFLALTLLPLASAGLVALVVIETLVDGYRVVRSDRPLRAHLDGRVGYVVVRLAEAGVAVVGVLVAATALPALFAESTPAPIGVGLLLLAFAVGLAILLASLLRATAELFVYRTPV